MRKDNRASRVLSLSSITSLLELKVISSGKGNHFIYPLFSISVYLYIEIDNRATFHKMQRNYPTKISRLEIMSSTSFFLSLNGLRSGDGLLFYL